MREVFGGVLTRGAYGRMCGCPALEASTERKVAMDKFADEGSMGNRNSIHSLLVGLPVDAELRNRCSPVVAFAEIGKKLCGGEMI